MNPEKLTIAALTFGGALSVLLMAFATERVWEGEERTCYNIPYTYVNESRLAFPAYGWLNPVSFDRVFVHPPTHYFEIGWLMKHGVPLYYAEAIPTVFWALAALLVIATAEFAFPTKLGLLCGAIAGIGWVASIAYWDYAFHLRPDAQMGFALFTGFIALAASQAQDWEMRRLVLGSLVVTYGCTVHYPAWCAWLGVLVFLGAMLHDLGWSRARSRVIWAVVAAMIVGIPYLLLHILPNRSYLAPYLTKVSFARIPQIIKMSFADYASLAPAIRNWHPPQMFYALPLNRMLVWEIPPFLAAMALLIWRKETRTLAVAFLPFPVFVFALFERKLWAYMYLECILLLAGFWLAAAVTWMRLADRMPAHLRRFCGPALALVFCIAFAYGTPELRKIEWKVQTHEFGFLRARAKEIIGENATVAGIHPLWYLSGGRRWYDLTPI